MAAAIEVTVAKRVYFRKTSITAGEQWYYIILSGFGLATLTDTEIVKYLKDRGYTNIEMRYYSATWP
jgi:hypothetical protein